MIDIKEKRNLKKREPAEQSENGFQQASILGVACLVAIFSIIICVNTVRCGKLVVKGVVIW